MAEPEKAGTPPTEAPGSESAGTGAQAVDDSEQNGKPVDPALAMTWKQKAERVNEVERRLAEAQAQLEAYQRQQYQQQAASDPMAAMLNELRQQAAYDPDKARELALWTVNATQQAELQAERALNRLGLTGQVRDMALQIHQQSGYRTPMEQCAQMARGQEVPDLAKQLEAERKRVQELEKVLNQRTVGGSSASIPSSTTPAAVSGDEVPEMTAEQYAAALARGGPEAIALRDKGVRIKR